MKQAIKRIEKILFLISALSLVLMMFLVSLDVLFRYFLRKPLTFQYEFTSYYLLVTATTLALPIAYRKGAFIKLDLLGQYLPRKVRGYLHGVNLTIGSVLFFAIAGTSASRTFHEWQGGGTIFGVIDWPVWLSLIWVPLGCSMLGLTLLIYAFDHFNDPLGSLDTTESDLEEY